MLQQNYNVLAFKNFKQSALDKDNNEIHFLETSVEVTLSINGVEKRFKRIMTENWVAKRGSDEKTYNGNTTEGFINDVPKKINRTTKKKLALLLMKSYSSC